MSLETRSWLARMSETGNILDRDCLLLVSPVLHRVRRVHPGGLSFSVALEMGAEEDAALLAGSVCEMFYAACSVTDDLQDGDTDEYMGDVPMALRINAQVQLLSLVAVRLNELSTQVDPTLGLDLSVDAYRTLAIMLTGQRLEITRTPWNGEMYERVARQSAGEQFRFYMKVSAVAAGCEPGVLGDYGHALGVFLQILADAESEDERLLDLGTPETHRMWESLQRELKASAARCKIDCVSRDVNGLLSRCQRLDTVR